MYKLHKSYTANQVTWVQRLSDGMFIPMNPENSDYQAYLEWVSEGNQPEPADE
jgi:hypothetical protein